MSTPRLAQGIVAALLALGGPLRAESLRVHGNAAAALALGDPQTRETGLGGHLSAAAEAPLSDKLGVALEIGGLVLSDGKAPSDPTLVDPSGATALMSSGQIHLRPFRSYEYSAPVSSGLWLNGGVGIAGTGGLTRMMVDTHLGYDFVFEKSQLQWGPALGLLHVFQPDAELRPADANVVLVGLHVVFDTEDRAHKDTDGDGLIDALDKCPRQPEDKDRFEDADGCPDPDNDRDNIPDEVDHCPNQAEDRDDYEDEDGCPERDNDKDGLDDPKDKCPNEAEDRDQFEDEDGCPDPDNDRDSIPDTDDLCPNEPETKNDYADHDGCPDSQEIRVVGDHIVLDDHIHFAVNTPKIRDESYPLLNRLAALIKDNPDYVHIEIQGHTDSEGPDDFNLQLSQDRAESVLEYLVDRGVERGRLAAKGFGETKPLVQETNEYARFMNRRVDFTIQRSVTHIDRAGGSAPGAITVPGEVQSAPEGAAP